MNKNILFYEYFNEWISLYKEGSVKRVTLRKYLAAATWLEKLAPRLKLKDLSRSEYQRIINSYGDHHEKQTTKDFHTQLKASVEDAVSEDIIKKNPVYKITIKGLPPKKNKKSKFLHEDEAKKLVSVLNLDEKEINWDWFILLLLKTGLRFAEALALTPEDFDFEKQTLRVNKSWDYKFNTGFIETKNVSSIRTIAIDWSTSLHFMNLTNGLDPKKPFFIKQGAYGSQRIHNSTVLGRLTRLCKQAEIPKIGLHSLRHTHASILLKEGVSIASVARRLGHSNMTTTQKVYLHVIRELESKDNLNIMRTMASF